MNRRRVVRSVVGAAVGALGLLWIAQGSGLLEIRPVLCLAECEPVTGGSIGWTAAGVAVFAASLAVSLAPRRRR